MLSICFKIILNVVLILNYNPIDINTVNIDTFPSEVPEDIIEELEIITSRRLKTANPDCFLVEQNSKFGIECSMNLAYIK